MKSSNQPWFNSFTRRDSSNNAIVQTYLDKVSLEGYVAPSQAKIDVYNAAWDYADAQGITPLLDLLGVPDVENVNLTKIPFIHSAGAAARFTLEESPVFTADKGIKCNTPGHSGSGYLNTHWNPVDDGINYTLNNCSIGVHTDYTLNDVDGLSAMGATGNVDQESDITLFYLRILGNFVGAINGDVPASTAVPTPAGLSCMSINGGNTRKIKNGIVIQTVVAAPIELTSADFFVCADNVGSSGIGQNNYPGDIQVFFAGSGTIDQVKLYTLVNMLLL